MWGALHSATRVANAFAKIANEMFYPHFILLNFADFFQLSRFDVIEGEHTGSPLQATGYSI